MANGTTIQIDRETKAILASLKDHPRETWGDVVRRIAEDTKRESVKAGARRP